MTETRYQRLFARLTARREGAFIPFATLGDPDHTTSAAILETLVRAGADALELGLPFSDPVADGPVIQAAATRALTAGATVDSCCELVRGVRTAGHDLPIGLLVYANLVWNRGLDRFYREASEAGVDSVLVADLPLAESGPFHAAAESAGVSPVLIVPPNASDRSIERIARATRGYTYVTTRSGVTGEGGQTDPGLVRTLTRLGALDAPPAILGFGIATPEQARAGVAAGAAGVIAGSAVVRLIGLHGTETDRLAFVLAEYVAEMKRATIGVGGTRAKGGATSASPACEPIGS
jgi:tryptophan synthase alpha chain